MTRFPPDLFCQMIRVRGFKARATPQRSIVGSLQLRQAHETVALLLLGLIALHASAAFYHHYRRRDDALMAMLPQAIRVPR
jgi:cytochrome b561